MDTVTTSTTTAATATPTAPPSASDLNRRLALLEARVGMVGGPNQNSKHMEVTTIPQRLVTVRREYEQKIAAAASASGGTTDGATTAKLMMECIKMLQELDPEIALTHQQQPLLYKRQQVLAASSELKANFHHLDVMLQLLLTGTRPAVPQNNRAGLGSTGDGGGETFSGNKLKTASSDPKEGNTSDPHKESEHKVKQKQQDEELQRQKRMAAGGNSGAGAATALRVEEIAQAPILTEYYGTVLSPHEQAKLAAVQHQIGQLQLRSTALQSNYHEILECYNTTMNAVSKKMILVNEQITAKVKQQEQEQKEQQQPQEETQNRQ